MKEIATYIGLIIILTLIGFLASPYFADFSFSQLDKGSIQLTRNGIGGAFKVQALFSLYIGSIPLFYFVIQRITKIKFLNKGLYAIGMILGCGVLLWQFRIFQISNRLQKLSKFDRDDGVIMTMDIGDFNFELYLFIGFLIGAILSSFIFKKK